MYSYQCNENHREKTIMIYSDGYAIGSVEARNNGFSKIEFVAYVNSNDNECRFEHLTRCSCFAEGKQKVKEWWEAREKTEPKSSVSAAFLPASDAGFFPTPDKLAGEMLAKVSWEGVQSVLEPSAGKGDLIRCLRAYKDQKYESFSDVDAIEKDENLRAILDSKDIRVVGEDFLSFQTHKRYDLILMNPPFSNGDEHLLKAIEMQKFGGQIVCLLNAETIRNAYTNRRKILAQQLIDLGAHIYFFSDAFRHAERKARVEVALVYLQIPAEKRNSVIFDRMKRAQEEEDQAKQKQEIIPDRDWMEQMVFDFEVEARTGVELLREYAALSPYLMSGSDRYAEPLIQMRIGKCDVKSSDSEAVNTYLRLLRSKYWFTLFNRDELTSIMTSSMRKSYQSSIDKLREYDFSADNIRRIMRQVSMQLTDGVSQSIMDLFEKLSTEHSYFDECSKNIHYYNGWKTNKAHKVGMKAIIPVCGAFSSYSWNPDELQSYVVYEVIADLERALNFLDRGETTWHMDISRAIEMANKRGEKKISFTFFDVVFYKKGTCHITFHKDAAILIDRLNIYAGIQKAWLPPVYGKKSYQDMNDEEKAVIDDFQGEAKYNELMKNPDHFLPSVGAAALPLLNPAAT